VPLESLAFVLGGVVVQELAVALIVLLVTAFAFAVIGILFSAFVRTTLASTVLSYIVALMVTVGLPVLMLVAVALVEPMRYNLDSLNWIVEAALTVLLFILLSLSPMSAAVLTEVFLEQENTMWFFWYTVDSTHRIPILSPWITYAAIYLALALVLLLITILRVRQQERR
jgi:hypothetical protein